MATQTTAKVTLRARPGVDPVTESVLTYSPLDGVEEWLLVELDSRDDLPFKAQVEWANAGSDGGRVQLSVSRGTRVCLFGQSMVVRAANLSGSVNTVVARISPIPAPVSTENVLDAYDGFVAAGTNQYQIPRYAKWVRLEVANPAAKAGALLELVEPFTGLAFASYALAEQPSPGVPIGDALRVDVTVTAATKIRLTYGLNL